jgi:cytochrome P450
MSEKFPFLSAEYATTPQPFWTHLRETDPVYYSETYGFWVISKHADILAIAKDPMTFSSSAGPGGGLTAELSAEENAGIGFLPMIQNDPPEHTRIRALFTKAFTPKRVSLMEPQINEIAESLMDEIRQKVSSGAELDLVDDFASPLPVYVIAKMMGIPVEERHRLKMWSESMAIGLGEGYSLKQQASSLSEMSKSMKEIVKQARLDPQNDTLIGAMVHATEDGESLRDDELLGLCKLLWLAGNETTTNLISNGAVFLLDNTHILEQLRSDKSLIPEFVEEMLRYNGPVMGLFRTATVDVEMQGKQIKAGDAVWLLFSSGNLDSDAYDEADKFDLHRRNKDHLAMGKGIHFCIGSSLAKLEAKVAFEWLVDVLPHVELKFEQGKRIPVPILSGWVKLPMTIDGKGLVA